MEISNHTIKVTYSFFRAKIHDYDRMNVRLFEREYGLEPYNIILEILYYYMNPTESIDSGLCVSVSCEYDTIEEFEKGKMLGQKLEMFLYRNWNRIVDFLKLYGEDPPTLSQIKIFKSELIAEFDKECGK